MQLNYECINDLLPAFVCLPFGKKGVGGHIYIYIDITNISICTVYMLYMYTYNNICVHVGHFSRVSFWGLA